MTPQLFAELKVSKELAKALDRLGLEEASPAQAAVVSALAGRRSAVIATPPGSGRRTAVAIAAVEATDAAKRGLQVLVLTGTRERALQLTCALASLAAGRKGLGFAAVFAGQSPDRQAALLKDKPCILVGTPGRLREVLESPSVVRDAIHTVVLDGVDDLIEAGYGDDLQALLSGGPEGRQILALTTFISPDVESLAADHCPDASRVAIPPVGTPPPLTWYDVEVPGRLAAISLLADRHLIQRGLIFTNSPLVAEEIAGQLSAAGYPAEALLTGGSAAAKERMLKKYRAGDITFLVTTDAGIRGVEIESIDIVVHYEWPLDDESLVTRLAGLRAGGQSFALVSGRQVVRARAFSRRGSPARMGRLPLLSEVPEARLQASVARLRDALSIRNPAACRTIVDVLTAEGFEPAVIAGAAIRLLGPPELPSQVVPTPLPVPTVAEPSVPVSKPNRGRASVARPVEPVFESVPEEPVAPAEEPVDWSPGVSVPATEEYAPAPAAESSEGSGDEAGSYEGGGAYTADGYVITDNVSEDGVVYPPGANFGDDSEPEFGFGGGGSGGSGGGGDRRGGGRRERGGRGRGRAGDGGPATPGMRRLWLNVGRMDRIQPKDIVGCILGETGIPPVSVGKVLLFERHSLVDVSGSFESQIIEALNRTTVRGRKLKAKVAAY